MNQELIFNTVQRVFGVSRAELTGKRRHKQISDARQCAAYFVWYHLNATNEALARLFKRSRPWASYVKHHLVDVCEHDKMQAARVNKVACELSAVVNQQALEGGAA